MLALIPAAIVAQDRPNIVLVVTDDQGWADIGYNSDTSLETPALDAMAAAGARFDRFYAAAPVCSPTRASILTGRAPVRTGVPDHTMAIDTREITLPQLLLHAGYATAHYGKWHLGGIPKDSGQPVTDDGPHPGTMGFQEWFSHFNYFDLRRQGIEGLYHNGTAVDPVDGEPCELLMDRALPWMREQAAADRPFFVCIWFPHPHRPHRPQEGSVPQGPEDRRHRALMGEVVEIDRQMGRLREALRAWRIADDTLLWFTSDNGVLEEGTVDDGLTGFKGDFWEGGIRVPAIVEWPGRIRPQRIADWPASTMDILPTILDLIDLPAPERPIDGFSLWPLLSTGERSERPPIPFWRILRKHRMPPANAAAAEAYQEHHAVLIHGRYKLHRNPWQVGGSKQERRLPGVDWALYDVVADPAEEHDLIQEQPAVAEAMRRALLDWQASATASMLGGDYAQP